MTAFGRELPYRKVLEEIILCYGVRRCLRSHDAVPPHGDLAAAFVRQQLPKIANQGTHE